VLTDEVRQLPIWNVEWIDSSPNGRFLVYGQKAGETKESIFSYDLSTHVTQTLAVNISQPEREQWYEPPTLSADGQSLVVVRGTLDGKSVSVFEIVKGTNYQIRQVGLYEPFVTWDIAWSPVARQFVYGATDIEQEIAPMPNYLFLVDMRSGKIRRLAKASDFYLGPILWSPNGKQIAITQISDKPSEVCILDVDTGKQTCPPIGLPAWSPTGEHIAFVDAARNLAISKPDGSEKVIILENIGDLSALFWRQMGSQQSH
jgi:Tol biopolymer transport system component